ncbi:MAG: Gfo/Idh/MocA family oxidoreductase [Chloroflexota bacterium]
MEKHTKLRWGILGPGAISTKFAIGLQATNSGELIAVGSRNFERATAFAEKFGAPQAYGSYSDLVADSNIDAIYIGTPHSYHKDHAILCMRAGKHALCEKPFAINAKEAAEMIAVAEETGAFLMEAMWSRFLPSLVKTREIIADGTIGEPRMIYADFGFRMGTVMPEHRLFDPKLGGGALLDVGIYPLSLASMLFGAPTQISSMANLGTTGVDEESAILLGHEGGQMAICSTAIQLNTPHEAQILGTDGSIKIQAPWWSSSKITLNKGDVETTFHLPYKGNGYTHEAEEVAQRLAKGVTESAVMPLAESLTIMQTMDKIREQWNLKYPNDI